MVSIPLCGCHGKPARYSSGLLVWKSSSIKNGSNCGTWEYPKARLRWTPAPSMVGRLLKTLAMRRIVIGISPWSEMGSGRRIAGAGGDFNRSEPTRTAPISLYHDCKGKYRLICIKKILFRNSIYVRGQQGQSPIILCNGFCPYRAVPHRPFIAVSKTHWETPGFLVGATLHLNP